EEFRHMPDLPNLRALAIGGNARVTIASMPRIARWQTLHRLGLQIDEITDDCVAHIVGLTELRELDLSYSGITDAGLRHLAPLTNLDAIDLSETAITQHGLAPLAALPRLRRLNLINTHIWQGDGVRELVRCCRFLEELKIGSHFQTDPLPDADLEPLL